MHAPNVALLLLATYAAAPILAAPLFQFNARSENGRAALNNRDFFKDRDSSDDSPSFTPRGDTPEQLATRESGPGQDIHARSILSGMLARLMNRFGFRIHIRDVSPDQLAARDDLNDFIDLLTTRELDPQTEIQARSTPDDLSETMAWGAAPDDFINALLKSRDSPKITPDDLFALASLASRALDSLD